jgi:hypothetical protein
MTDPLRIFIGYDSKEAVAYHVLSASILRRTTIPVALIPLTRQSVSRIYTRRRGPTESTEFSLTRFLVPYLSDYRGLSVFMDCDMLMRVDLLELWFEILARPGHAVWCCQHDYIPKALTKFDGHEQTRYPRKNWSSFLVFDNAQCRALTPDYVNHASGLDLHRFHWLTDWTPPARVDWTGESVPTPTDQAPIGSLPLEWNWLVGEYDKNPKAKNLHFTNGTPCFPGFADCDHADEWWTEYRDMSEPAIGRHATDDALWALVTKS